MPITFKVQRVKTEHITENEERFLNITEMRLYSKEYEKIFLEIAPVRISENSDIMWEDWNYYNSLRIFKTDYEMLFVPLVERIFPVIDPDSDEVQARFDVCSLNWIGKADTERLIGSFSEGISDKTGDERQFLEKITEYLRHYIDVSDLILIEGNL